VTPVAVLAGLAPSLAFPLLGTIADQLHVSPSTATWVLTSAFLASAVVTPLLGRLSDLFGYRRVLILALTIALAGSVLVATTPSFPLLIAGRVLQGIAAPLYPLAIGLLQSELEGERLHRSVSLASVLLAAGAGAALVVAGFGGSHSDYRTVFWLPVAVCVAAIAAVSTCARATEPSAGGRVDLLGALLLSGALVLILLPLSRAARLGLGSPVVLGCLAAGAVVAAVFVSVERRVTHPILPGRLLRNRTVVVSTLTSMCAVSAVFVPMVTIPILAQADPAIIVGGPASPLVVALVYLLPGTLLGSVGAPLGVWSVRRRGVRAAVATAGVLAVVGSATMVLAPAVPLALVAGLTVTMVALFICYGAIPLLVIDHVDRGDLGVVNAVSSLGRWVGSAVMTALVSLILSLSAVGEPLARVDFRWTFLLGVAASAGVVTTAFFLPRAGTRRSP